MRLRTLLLLVTLSGIICGLLRLHTLDIKYVTLKDNPNPVECGTWRPVGAYFAWSGNSVNGYSMYQQHIINSGRHNTDSPKIGSIFAVGVVWCTWLVTIYGVIVLSIFGLLVLHESWCDLKYYKKRPYSSTDRAVDF